MLRVLLFAAMALVLCPANSSAELVGNVIDDFSNPTSASAAGIDRTQTFGATATPAGYFFVGGSPSFASVIYTADSAATFGGIDVDFVNGVSFSTSSAFGGTFSVKAFGGDGVLDNQVGITQMITGGPVTFSNDFSSFKTLRFEVQGVNGGVATLGGTLTAVPEPTSFALFGVLAAGIGYRRRRR